MTEARGGKSSASRGHVLGAASPAEKVRPTAQVHAEAGWVLAPGAARVVPGASQLLRRRVVAELTSSPCAATSAQLRGNGGYG